MRRRRMIPAMTPMTIPAIAPPLRPPPLDCEVPMRVAPFVPTGAMKDCVVVATPVDVTVITPLLVGL